MDRQIEEVIIKNFFVKDTRKRVLFELSSNNKRRLAIDRLCHNYSNILIPEQMITIEKPNSNHIDICNAMKRYGAGDLCYSISSNEEIDGKILPLSTALQHAVGYGFPSIVSCISGKVAYFEAEQESGAPPRFILKKV